MLMFPTTMMVMAMVMVMVVISIIIVIIIIIIIIIIIMIIIILIIITVIGHTRYRHRCRRWWGQLQILYAVGEGRSVFELCKAYISLQ